MARLTPREREVARLLAQGKRQKAIAQELCISPLTVREHLKNARDKTGAASSLALALQIALEDSTKQG